MKWSALFVGIVMIVLNNGCSGPEYTLKRAKSLELLEVRNISDRTWQTHIPINRYDGYPSMKRLWYNSENIYYLYKKRKRSRDELPYILYGLTTKRINQFSNTNQLKEIGLKPVELKSLSGYRRYHAFIPELNLYVKAKLYRGYNTGYAIFDDFYDVVFEITDRYDGDPDAKKLIGNIALKKALVSFVHSIDNQNSTYRLSEIVDTNRSQWFSFDNHPDEIEGSGRVKLRFKDSTYLSYVLIDGMFRNGRLVSDAKVEVKSSYCVEWVLICVKFYTDTYTETVPVSQIKRAIKTGMDQTVARVKEKVSAYYQRSSSRRSSGSGKSADIKVSYFGYEAWNKHNNYKYYYKGQYEGLIFAHPEKNTDHTHYLATSSYKSCSFTNGYFYADRSEVWTSSCGSKSSVNTMKEAVEAVATCVCEGHY